MLIVKGGDWFTDSAVSISKAFKLPEIIIGATVVSLATTLPEVVVSVTAASKGYTTMSIGNAIGSVICNTGLVLALVCFIKPVHVKGEIFKIKSVIMMSYLVIAFFLSHDSIIDMGDSFILLILLLLYLGLDLFILLYNRNQNKSSYPDDISLHKVKTAFLFVTGAIFILTGANLLISHGVTLANFIGVPESVISLTLIAFGTSLPELVTALSSFKKGHTGLSIGNILGANILNITLVIGGSGIFKSLAILEQNVLLDYPIAIILLAILIFPCLIFNKITRTQSFLLLLVYFYYIYIVFSSYTI